MGDIGFMKAPERLNVLVSRARNCLIMIGNMETFMNSRHGKACWLPFFALMQEKEYLHDGLQVHCERHPDRVALLAQPQDFDTHCPDGGCTEACNATLKCGRHTCNRRCHRIADHSQMACHELIETTCEKEHKFRVQCGEPHVACGICRQEQDDLRRRIKRGYELEKQRQERQSQYRQELKNVQDEVDHQRRLLKYAQEEDADERLLAEQQATLASLKETVARQKVMKKTEAATKETKSSSVVAGDEAMGNDMVDWDTASSEHEWHCMKREQRSKSAELDALMQMIGLQTIKRSFLDIKTTVDTATRQGLSLKNDRYGCSLLGNPGTGKLKELLKAGSSDDVD